MGPDRRWPSSTARSTEPTEGNTPGPGAQSLDTLLRLALAFLYPLGLSLLLGGVALALNLLGRRRDSAIALGSLISILWLSSTPGVASLLTHSLERQNPHLGVAATPVADAIVVLGGALSIPRLPSEEPNLVSASDRILHTARLYRAGKAPLVIVSGGTNPRWGGLAEGPFTARLLTEWGVPPDDIAIESISTTTYENALESARIIEERGLDRVLLVTSALHMPRSLLTFRSAGVDVIPAPTDHQNQPNQLGTLRAWLPRSGALDQTTLAIHEYLGMAVYRWRGWIHR